MNKLDCGTVMARVTVLFIYLCFISPVNAMKADAWTSVFTNSDTKIKFRYRLETVDQNNIDNDAKASTLQSRLTWQSSSYYNFSALVEVDNVSVIGANDYNSTINGKSEFPVVADPKGTDLNQISFKYNGDRLTFIGGRQRILHNNQRFVGGVAWRQNEQTFDAARFQFNFNGDFTVDYSYVGNINRIFGPDDGTQPADWRGNFHLLNAGWQFDQKHKLLAFTYLFENDTNPNASSNTYGIDYTGYFGPLVTRVSFALQSDAGESSLNYSTDYYKAEFTSDISHLKLTAGVEILGSNKGVGFATPLATLHKFQGFADQFLSTPTQGIEDFYISAESSVYDVKLSLTYHDFGSYKGDITYGTEVDLVASYKFSKSLSALLKFAAYDADAHAVNTNKFWVMVSYDF